MGSCDPPGWQNFTKNGDSNLLLRWTDATLVFKISGSFTDKQIKRIQTAAANIQENTGGCVKLREVTSAPSGNYVDVINSDSGCYSYIGMLGDTPLTPGGKQVLNLDEGCLTNGIIEHEFLHALGVYHEQGRPDRCVIGDSDSSHNHDELNNKLLPSGTSLSKSYGTTSFPISLVNSDRTIPKRFWSTAYMTMVVSCIMKIGRFKCQLA